MAIQTLNDRFHVYRPLWIVLLGSLLLGILFSLSWVTAAYGHLRLTTYIVRWITAGRGPGLSGLYHGTLYCLALGAMAGLVVAVLDRMILKKERSTHPR